MNKSLTSLKYVASRPSSPRVTNTKVSAAVDTCHVCSLLLRSVCNNNITGDGADSLAKVVLEHNSLTDFCSIPLVSLRENSVMELDLQAKGVGVPGAIVLSRLMPAATALKSLKCACNAQTHHEKVSAAADACVCAPIRSLEYNKIGAIGAKALGKALETNSTLQTLKYAASRAGSLLSRARVSSPRQQPASAACVSSPRQQPASAAADSACVLPAPLLAA